MISNTRLEDNITTLQDILEETDKITMTQMVILMEISRHDSVRKSEIVSKLGIAMGGVDRIVGKYPQYVDSIKNPDNTRSLSITGAGRVLIKRFMGL